MTQQTVHRLCPPVVTLEHRSQLVSLVLFLRLLGTVGCNTHTHRERQRERKREKERERKTEKEKQTEREREREKETKKKNNTYTKHLTDTTYQICKLTRRPRLLQPNVLGTIFV